MCKYMLALTILGICAPMAAQTTITPELRECYTNPALLDRNNLPPMTMKTLIDIIQQIEEINSNIDLVELSALLLHTLRQDGIIYNETLSDVPYAPIFNSFYRHKLLLTKLIPSNNKKLATDFLPSALKCALHHMLSTTIDRRLRSDDANCGHVTDYKLQREHFTGVPMKDFVDTGNNKILVDQIVDSGCSINDGVIHTPCGAISAGNLIAGIAAGASPQIVSLSELMTGLIPTGVEMNVSNIYPATLSGDLAEAIIIQGTSGASEIHVGNAGMFNSSQAQRFFMVNNGQTIEMTDPEIRGGVDGFVLGSRVTNVLQTFKTLKLSQLLDMYYVSRNGVFDPSFRACNRVGLTGSLLGNNTLVKQTESFAAAMANHIPVRGTITNFRNLVNNSVNTLLNYIDKMRDLKCTISEKLDDTRLKINLYIVLDATWAYTTIYPAISYILDSIEVGTFGSSVTLLNAWDGSVVVPQTFSIADFHSQYTLTNHESLTRGVDLQSGLASILKIMQKSFQKERLMDYVGGNSTVLLFMLNTKGLENNKASFKIAQTLTFTVPDLRILFATSTNGYDNIGDLVRDVKHDIYVIDATINDVNAPAKLEPILKRIQQTNRRIINPLCGYEYNLVSSGKKQFDDFIEPGYIQFYAISPNYFFENNDDSIVRISHNGRRTETLTVCYSRATEQPRRLGADSSVYCEDLASSGQVKINLQDACQVSSEIEECPPMYISVQAATVINLTATCTDPKICRFPYNIRYTVQIEDLQCFTSNKYGLGASLVNIVITITCIIYL